MKASWGRLIAAALDAGYAAEDAVWVVLSTAHKLETMDPADLTPRAQLDVLTPRELEALRVLARVGPSRMRPASPDFSAAAVLMGVSRATVREFAKQAREKLGVTTTFAAVERAVELGLLSVEAKAA